MFFKDPDVTFPNSLLALSLSVGAFDVITIQ